MTMTFRDLLAHDINEAIGEALLPSKGPLRLGDLAHKLVGVVEAAGWKPVSPAGLADGARVGAMVAGVLKELASRGLTAQLGIDELLALGDDLAQVVRDGLASMRTVEG